MSDPYYNSVTLLLHGNGANDGTTFTDDSSYGRSVTVGATSVYTKTAVKKFGSASIKFYAATDSYLTTAQSTDLDLDSGDMTVEAWVYPTTTNLAAIVGNRGSSTLNYLLQLGSVVQFITNTPESHEVNGTTSVTTNTWHHVAFTKSGNDILLFLDGNLEGSCTLSGNPSAPDSSAYGFQIGREWTVNALEGYIDDLRITKGVARYTESFTPPTEEFSNEAPPPGTGDSDITLPVLTVYAGPTFAGFPLTLPSITSIAYCGGDAAATLPVINGSSCGGANASATLRVLTMTNRSGEVVGFSLPALTASSIGGSGALLTLPSLTSYATAHDATGDRSAAITLPSLTATANSGAATKDTLPALSAAATGTVPWIATSVATLPALTATIDARSSAVARAEPLLPALTAQGYSGAVCSVTVGALTLAASGTTGVAGAVTATLPLFVAVATGSIGNTASADITLPSMSMSTGWKAPISLPSLNLVAIGTATVAVSYEAYALNLKHTNDKTNDELTRYTNFPFDRIVRYKDSYYGMNATGLYLLEGTTDDGDPIPWEVETHITDFGSPKLKTVQHAYFGGRLGPDATVTLSVGEKADNSYSYTTPRGQTVQNYRQVFGKGAKARYFSVGVAGEDEIELDSLELAVTAMARRI